MFLLTYYITYVVTYASNIYTYVNVFTNIPFPQMNQVGYLKHFIQNLILIEV